MTTQPKDNRDKVYPIPVETPNGRGLAIGKAFINEREVILVRHPKGLEIVPGKCARLISNTGINGHLAYYYSPLSKEALP